MDKFVKTEILEYIKRNPYPNTELVIGGAVRVTELKDYVLQIQQVMRPTLDLTKPTRIVNFDPGFDSPARSQISFLHEFFKSKDIGFTYDDSEGMHVWRSKDNIIEVIIVNIEFNYSGAHGSNENNSDWFFQGLIDSSLQNNSKLIVQDYSGRNTRTVFKMFFEMSPNKQEFKNNILFDFSYGNNHCDIDLLKYQPIFDPSGNFVNIMLMSVEELLPLLHTHPFIDEHIHSHYISEYRNIIDVIPVDYRRKMKIEAGDNIFGLVGYKNLYTIDTSFDEIINILRRELMPVLTAFREIGIMNPGKDAFIEDLLSNYRNYTLTSNPNVDHWSNQFIKIIN